MSWFSKKKQEITDKLAELQAIEAALNKKLSEANTIYETIKSFRGLNVEFYAWVCAMISSDQYKYMLFDIRENVIREMSGETDKEKIMRAMGRLDMVNIIDNYLKRYKEEYENSIRRDTEDNAR